MAASLLYRVKEKRVLEPMEAMALQGIFPEDFPAMRPFSETKPKGLMRDLAGNAFSSTVCMAVLVAGFVHAPLEEAERARGQIVCPNRRQIVTQIVGPNLRPNLHANLPPKPLPP